MFKDNEGEEAFGPTMTYWKWWKEDAKHDGKVAGSDELSQSRNIYPQKDDRYHKIKPYLMHILWYQIISTITGLIFSMVPTWHPSCWSGALPGSRLLVHSPAQGLARRVLVETWHGIQIFHEALSRLKVKSFSFPSVHFSRSVWRCECRFIYIYMCFRVRMDSPTVRNQLCQGLFWRPKRQPSNNPGIELNQGTQRLRCKIYIRVWNPKGFLIRKIRGYSQHRVSSSPDEHVKDLRLHIVEKADGVRQPWGNGARSLKIEGSGGYLDQIFRDNYPTIPCPQNNAVDLLTPAISCSQRLMAKNKAWICHFASICGFTLLLYWWNTPPFCNQGLAVSSSEFYWLQKHVQNHCLDTYPPVIKRGNWKLSLRRFRAGKII